MNIFNVKLVSICHISDVDLTLLIALCQNDIEYLFSVLFHCSFICIIIWKNVNLRAVYNGITHIGRWTNNHIIANSSFSVSDFTQQLSQLYEQHGESLQMLVSTFRKRNSELRKERWVTQRTSEQSLSAICVRSWVWFCVYSLI